MALFNMLLWLVDEYIYMLYQGLLLDGMKENIVMKIWDITPNQSTHRFIFMIIISFQKCHIWKSLNRLASIRRWINLPDKSEKPSLSNLDLDLA